MQFIISKSNNIEYFFYF
uniref:Uncharacterized protein n=1 Tax=Anguilla anguilla TaxID=7936 RepID=A0A0E9PV49_ANGAN